MEVRATSKYILVSPQKARLVRIGTADLFMHEAGNQEHARGYFGLTPEKIAENTFQALPVGVRSP